MKRLLPLIAASIMLAPPRPVVAQVVSGDAIAFTTADGVRVFGDLYRADAPADAPIILLFHQGGGDARGEYGPLAEHLLERGYHALAIDQRRGGNRFGSENRTVASLGGTEFSYCDAYPDLEGALAFAADAGFTGPRVLWGSSYSAALVFRLAVERPAGVAAVLAFSPASGDPMAGCEPAPYSARITVPVLVLRPQSEMEIERVADQLARFAADGHDTFVADPGVHGSSMLNEARVGEPTYYAWAAVFRFLDRALDRER